MPLSAVKDVSSPEVTITITENEDKIRVHIADNGPALFLMNSLKN